MQATSRVEFANTLRGAAAVSVVVSHYLGVFWLHRETVASLTAAPPLDPEATPTPGLVSVVQFSPWLNWGSLGVALFFIISGFVIPFSLERLSVGGFALSRTMRIVPTYVAGFSLTLLAIYVSSRHFGTEWPYTAREVWWHVIPGLRDVAGTRGIDGIVWTLEIEVKFYVVCAALIVLFRRGSIAVFAAPVVAAMGAFACNAILPDLASGHPTAHRFAMSYLLGSQYVVFMFIGVAFHYLFLGRMGALRTAVTIGVLYTLFHVMWLQGPDHANIRNAASYVLAVLVFSVAFAYRERFTVSRVPSFLASISYPLYVVHGVAGYATLRVLINVGVPVWASLPLVTVGAVAIAWVLHVTVEQPTQRAGRRLAARVSGAPA